MATILKKYKNMLFKEIQDSGLDSLEFSGRDSTSTVTIVISGVYRGFDGFLIQYKDTPLVFFITNHEDYLKFVYRYHPFVPDISFMVDSGSTLDFSKTIAEFRKWLIEVKKYIEEESTPDLWQQIISYRDYISSPNPSESDYYEFSQAEKVQIKVSITEFQRLVIENYNPSIDQQNEIKKRLDYLKDAVDRLNRFDWKALAISTVISIAVALSLDTEAGRHLFELFHQAFHLVVKLLQ